MMRFMHWSYKDLCECPQFHLDVLFEEVQQQHRNDAHEKALAEARAGMRRRR